MQIRIGVNRKKELAEGIKKLQRTYETTIRLFQHLYHRFTIDQQSRRLKIHSESETMAGFGRARSLSRRINYSQDVFHLRFDRRYISDLSANS